MINVVIPMAGLGSRFQKAGYTTPKPFIPVNGKPMIARVMENLAIKGARYILIAQRQHLEAEKELVSQICDQYPALFIPIDGLSEGAACTVLYACKEINNDSPLLMANSDQLVDFDFQEMLDDAKDRNLDGSILTFKEPSRDPKWSYAKLDEKTSLVSETREKVALSEYATVGIYYFTQGRDFVNASIQMIVERNKSNNEYYVAPTYNYLIAQQKRIGIFNINQQQMHGLGTPEDLELYLERTSQ